jgi:3alpha(or 20beta)-hydroxysteroid dehydrogenase
MRLAGKVAIISGAASGMGAVTARMFAREGAKVVIGDVLEHEGRQVVDAIGASARCEPLDVTKEESWAAVVAATTRHFGKLDVLVWDQRVAAHVVEVKMRVDDEVDLAGIAVDRFKPRAHLLAGLKTDAEQPASRVPSRPAKLFPTKAVARW